MDYYYSLNNEPQGPVPLEQLHELFRSGVITGETLVVAFGGSEWRPYSDLPAAPQDLAGSAVPGEVPAGTPQPLPSATATPTSAVNPATAASAAPQPGYKNLALISWALIAMTALLSIIPILGCFSWVMLIPVVITCMILGVMTLQRGGPTQGILILIASLVVLPLITIIAPIVTTALFGAVTGLGDENKQRSSPAPRASDASPAPSGSVGAAQLFNELDITQNGYLSGTEMKDYESYDTNQDDQVSKEEFMAGRARDAAISAPPGGAGSADGSSNAPDQQTAKQMVNNTMINFKNAVNSGDFETFYRTQLSDLWKKQITADKLRTSFKSFVDRKVDLTPIFSVEPVLDEPPYVDGNGLLTLVGHYPVESEKVKVTFDLSYSREAKWALSGIKVNIKGINE